MSRHLAYYYSPGPRRRSRQEDHSTLYRHASTSDSDLTGFQHHPVARIVVGEVRRLEEHLHQYLQPYLDRIQDNATRSQGDPDTTDRLGETNEERQAQERNAGSGQPGGFQTSLQAQLYQLQQRVELVSQRLKKAEEEKSLANQKLRSSELKNQKLHKIILESGSATSGPNDEQIQKSFSTLRHKIWHLVNSHLLSNKYTGNGDAIYWNLSSEAKVFWLMSLISRTLHLNYFESPARHFGFDEPSNNMFADVYQTLSENTAVSSDSLEEWRRQTRMLAKSFDSNGTIKTDRARVVVDSIYKKLAVYLNSSKMTSVVKKAAPREEIKNALHDICSKAESLAYIFHTSRTEYEWLQVQNTTLDPLQVQVVGSTGFQTEYSPGVIYTIVFGGVVKGGGASGKLKDEVVHLSETEVLLGPFEK